MSQYPTAGHGQCVDELHYVHQKHINFIMQKMTNTVCYIFQENNHEKI